MDIAVIFPGQGTQQPGMGVRVDATTRRGRWSSRPKPRSASHWRTCSLEAPAEQLTRTREAQLAVLLTSLVVWEAAKDAIGTPARLRRATRSARSPR